MGDPSTDILSAGSILNGIGTNFVAGGNPITGAMMNAAALAGSSGFGSGGGSLFGFDPSLKGFGQGVMESIGGANTFMNQNPITSQIGFSLAKDMFTPQQTMVAPGQVSRGQIAPVDFMSLLNPQQSTVIRPAMPSLL